MASNYPSASASPTPRTEHHYKALRNFLNVSIVLMLGACAYLAPNAFERDHQWKFDQALNRCEQGYNAYCQQVANGDNYAR